MSTPEEEVQTQLLASIQSMAEAMAEMGNQIKRQTDITNNQYDAEVVRLADVKKQADERKKLEGDRLKEDALKNGRLKTSGNEEAQRNREISKQFRNRLGIEEEINPRLKKVLENRTTIEQRLVDAAKRQYGDDVFTSAQRSKLYREQLQQYSAGNLAYGGVVTQFKDFSKQQQDSIIDAAKTQKKLRMEQENLAQTVQALSHVKFEDLSKQQQDAAVEAVKTQQQLQKEQEKFTQTVQKLANPGAAVGNMKGKFSTLAGAVDTGKESMIKMAGGGMLATSSLEILFGVGKVLGAALEGAAKAALGMTKSLLSGERGMAVGAKATETLTKSITGAVSGFGSLLMGIGGVLIALAPFSLGLGAVAGAGFLAAGATLKLGAAAANTAAELNTLAAELNDKLYKGFAELGKASITGARGMTGVIDNLHKMGLTVSEFDKLNKVISANAKEMKMFGVTAEQGVNKFAETAGELYKSEMGRTFELMAISAEDQYEHTAKFLALQARLGLTQEKNSKQEQVALGAYIEELDKIATLTGAARKEQETAREAVMKIRELRSAILDEQDKKEKGDTGADARIERLTRYLDVATTFQQMGDAKMAKGAATTGSGNGAIIGEEGAAFYIMAQRQGLMKGLEQGGMSKDALDLAARRAYVEQAQSMSGVMRYGSDVGPLSGDAAIAGDTKSTLAELGKREAAEKTKLGDKYNQQEFIDRIIAERSAKNDPTTIKNVDNARLQMKYAVIMDNAAFALNEMLLNDINSKPTQIFSSAVDKFAEAVGYKGSKTEKPATSQAGRDAQAHRAAAVSLHDRAAALDRTIEADEKALKEAIRAGKTEEERKPLVERINKATAERVKVVEEILVHEKNARNAELKARELRQQQAKDRAELTRLQTANERDASKLGDLNEKRDLLLSRRQSTSEVDKEINETKSGIAERTEKITAVKSKLSPEGKFSGFGKENDDNIRDASKKFGMDEKTMRGFAKMEGGYSGEMSPTGAIGIGQFTESSAGHGGKLGKDGKTIPDGTWNSLAKTLEGIEIGMKPVTPENFRTPQDPRRDKRINMMATALLAKNNAKLLEVAGVPVTGENLYMVHNIGPGVIDAIKGKPVGPKVIEAMKHNGMKPGQSPVQFVAMQKEKFNTHERLANSNESTDPVVAAAPVTPTPVAAAPVTPVPTAAAPVTLTLVAAAPVTPVPTAAAPVTPVPTAAAPVTLTPVAAAPVTLAAKTEQTPIEPEFKTASQEEIDKTKAGRDNWFAKPKVAAVTPRPVAKAEPLPDPVADPKGYKAAVNARIMKSVSFSPVASVEEKTPQAKFGGLFNGPLSGYPVTLHGRETVTPMPNPNSLVASNEASTVQKEPLPTATPAAPTANADSGVLLELFKMLSDKMDTLSDHMASGNDTREELLKYSRV